MKTFACKKGSKMFPCQKCERSAAQNKMESRPALSLISYTSFLPSNTHSHSATKHHKYTQAIHFLSYPFRTQSLCVGNCIDFSHHLPIRSVSLIWQSQTTHQGTAISTNTKLLSILTHPDINTHLNSTQSNPSTPINLLPLRQEA